MSMKIKQLLKLGPIAVAVAGILAGQSIPQLEKWISEPRLVVTASALAALLTYHLIIFIFHTLPKKFKATRSWVNQKSELQYFLNTQSFNLKVKFKPTVSPVNFDYKDNWDIYRYINYIEKNRGSKFHIGMINDSLKTPLFDVTINPNDDVVLYGLEPLIIGNINREIVDYNFIAKKVRENKIVNYLTGTPFIKLLNKWSIEKDLEKIILSVNNPFWVIRNFMDKRPIKFNEKITSIL